MEEILRRIRDIIQGILRSLLARLLLILNRGVICQHFCRFREAGSNFRHVHVHMLASGRFPGNSNPQGFTGLGHDDETPGLSNPDDPMHNTVSRGDSCDFRRSPTPDMVLYPSDLQALMVQTAYVHPAPEDASQPCPPGFDRIECDCGAMCVTFDRHAWEVWHG